MRERRRFIRISENLQISYEVLSKPIPRDSLIKDISQGGIRFFTHEFVPKNSLLKIRLAIEKIHLYFETLVKVIWIREVSRSGRYEIGVEFTNISEESVKHLVDYLANIAEGNG